ncbi:hypothetical protein FHS24_001915 [Psychrobacter luti]|uniref:Uncharacterized protein n=1 Tax=Psychrobacter luti TaxID=198481 RepID=A0A839TE69_9GAMM|nr:hypothetical protein [Psychrobacter luti]MBB3107390.1 hypothetical protein [Psychrobacter luti]
MKKDNKGFFSQRTEPNIYPKAAIKAATTRKPIKILMGFLVVA